MTSTDWIIDIALLLIVLRQLREARLTAKTVILPAALVAYAASHYLHNIPTAGNDVVLIAAFTAVGAVFGLFGGLLTKVRASEGNAYVKASAGAAALWVTSMGFRLGFAVWSSHASGLASLTRFSAAHDITSGEAWTAALILMAFGEVAVRLGIIVLRGYVRAERSRTVAPLAASRIPASV
jgi:hypothetical protein